MTAPLWRALGGAPSTLRMLRRNERFRRGSFEYHVVPCRDEGGTTMERRREV